LQDELGDFDAEKARTWPNNLGRLISTAELSRWIHVPYHEIRLLTLDGILIPEPGSEPPMFHLAENIQRYVVYLRLKALARHLA
jgi:hypothetical protein